MPRRNDDDDEEASERDEEIERDEEDEEGEDEETTMLGATAGQPTDNDAAPEIEDTFDEEEEVLVSKPFPRTIMLHLPHRPSSSSSSSPSPSPSASPSTTASEASPTCVHVCLTRGSIRAAALRAPASHAHDRDEEEDGAAADLNESALLTTASRLQGCCAEAHRFESDYASRLAALRRRHILRRLHGNPERQRRFLAQERRADERHGKAALKNADDDADFAAAAAAGAEDDTHDGDAAGDGAETDPLQGVVWPWTSTQQPPPYWLPSLLVNDVQTFERVLQVMYGWVIAPEPHPSDRLRLNSAGQLLSGPSNAAARNGGDGEDDDDLDQADPAHHKPDFFLQSNAFGGADEEGDEAEAEDDEERAKGGSVVTDCGQATRGPQRASKSLLEDFNECEAEGEDVLDSPQSFESTASAPDLLPQRTALSDVAMKATQAKLSTATAPPPVVALPSFPFTAYEFFVAYDTTSEEWHLLDTHPLFVMEACRRLRAAQLRHRGGHDQDEAQHSPQQRGDDEEEEEEDEDADEKGSKAGDLAPPHLRNADGAAEDDVCPVPLYDLSTMIPVSPIILAALFSVPALRCCLLQPLSVEGNTVADTEGDRNEVSEGAGSSTVAHRVPDRAVLRTFEAAWLSVDVDVALPVLATICRARQQVLEQDATRIPYSLSPLWLDVRALFDLSGFKDAAQMVSPADVRQWCVRPGEEAQEEGSAPATHPGRPATAIAVSAALPHKWGSALDHLLPPEHYGRVVLSSLLAAQVLPTHALRLHLFTCLDGLRLALWWWLRLPQNLLRQWGIDGAASRAEEEAGLDVGEERDGGEDDGSGENVEDGEEEGNALLEAMRPDEATEALARRVAMQQHRDAQSRGRRQRQQGPVLLFAPLLQRVLLELQRRLDRCHGEDSEGKPLQPSQFTLHESVARTYAVERLDSGRPRQDPLVTTAFVGAASQGVDGDCHQAGAVAVRHHRLYQSDMVLLALAMTTTPAPLYQHKSDGGGGGAAASAAPERVVAVEVEEHEAADADRGDAHTALFQHIFEGKLLRCVRSPVDRARAGTTKLLLLCAADFRLSATRHCLFAHLPSYELFGNSGYCPLPELVEAWAGAASRTSDTQRHAAIHDAAFYLWNEVRWRLHKAQYSEAAVARMRGQLPELFETVAAHTTTYYTILTRLQREAEETRSTDAVHNASPSTPSPAKLPLKASAVHMPHTAAAAGATTTSRAAPARSGRPQRPSLISSAALHATKMEAQADSYETVVSAATSSAAAAAAAASASTASLPLTVVHPNVYSAAVLDSKAHVYALWSAFPVSPLTYWTPETLHVLLFGQTGDAAAASAPIATVSRLRHFNTAAVRVLLEHGIHTVQPCPLDTPEVSAIEAALSRADIEVVKVLLGLGAASLRDLRGDGSATLESWAETIFTPDEMAVLRFVETKNGKAARSDPRVHYGARRFEPAAMHA